MVYYLRRVANPFMLKSSILLLGLFIFGTLVHTANVITNMPAFSDVVGLSRFSYYAFVNTEFMVQATIVSLLFVAAWLIKDVVRTIIPHPHLPDLYIHAQ